MSKPFACGHLKLVRGGALRLRGQVFNLCLSENYVRIRRRAFEHVRFADDEQNVF